MKRITIVCLSFVLPLSAYAQVSVANPTLFGRVKSSTGSGLHAEQGEAEKRAKADCKQGIADQCDVIDANTLTYSNMDCNPTTEPPDHVLCEVACSAKCSSISAEILIAVDPIIVDF